MFCCLDYFLSFFHSTIKNQPVKIESISLGPATACGPSPEVKAQGIMDVFKFTDKEVVDKIIAIIKVIDVSKIESIMNAVKVDENGCLKITIDIHV